MVYQDSELGVLTFGSCLSASVADRMTRLFPRRYRRVSSVQHVRIDQFVASYIGRTKAPLLSGDFQVKPKARFVSLFDNQFDDRALGRSLPYGLPEGILLHPIRALESGKVDVIIIDTFPEVLFRLQRHIATEKSVYFHADHLEETPEGFALVPGFLAADTAVTAFISLVEQAKQLSPGVATVFVNFPVNGRKRDDVTARSKELQHASNQLWDIDRCGVIDLVDICDGEFEPPADPYHFTQSRYDQYAYLAHGLVDRLRR